MEPTSAWEHSSKLIGALAKYPKLRERFRKNPLETIKFMDTRFKKEKFSDIPVEDVLAVSQLSDSEFEVLLKLSGMGGALGSVFARIAHHEK